MSKFTMQQLEFAVLRDGPFYGLQERLDLVNRNDARIVRRGMASALIAWVPLLVLTALAGNAIGADPDHSFLLDFPSYGRFLVGLPMLLIADNQVDDRCVSIASYFANSGIIRESTQSSYRKLVASTMRLVKQPVIEWLLVGIAYLWSISTVIYDYSFRTNSWRHTESGSLTPAGWWWLLVSLPLFQFLLCRWTWRLIVWCVFLWRFSRLDLRLISVHPDSAGGLGILAESTFAFIPIFFATSAVLSSVWCRQVIYEAVDVTTFHRPAIGFVIAALLISIAPLIIFVWRLNKLKLHGLHDYGIMANQQAVQFDEKWIKDAEKNLPDVLGTPDISSLCDMTTNYQVVQDIKFFPFRLQNLIVVAVALCLPMIPLVLIEIPLKELVEKIGGALL